MSNESTDRSQARYQTDRLLSCIDRGLDCLGESVKPVIYWRLEHEYHISRKEIPIMPAKFSNNLKEMFGMGRKTVERKILEQLKVCYGTVNLSDCDFTSAIKLASRQSC